jgi:hypothetical protein
MVLNALPWWAVQLWFSRQSDISIREQLATQIILAIVSRELSPRAVLTQYPRTCTPVPVASEHGQRWIPTAREE